MAFSYDQLEDNLVTYLAPKITSAEVEVLPENENEYKQPKAKPIIYIAYMESDFQPSASTNVVKQEEDMVIVCNIRSAHRRGSGGINEMIGLLKKHLQGLVPAPGCKQLQLKKIELEDRDTERNYWIYNVRFTSNKPQAQVISEEEQTLGTFKELVVNDQYQ